MKSPRGKRSRRPEWSLALAVLLAWGGWYAARHLLPRPRPWGGPGRPATDWFLVARMPEAAKDEVGIAAHKKRLADWLAATRQAGFRPILLSEAVTRLRRGEDLPDKALVFVFTHSYRSTIDQLKPVFEAAGAPAVWLVDGEGMGQADEHFVSPHAWRLMRRSRLWDLGFHRASTGTFRLDGLGLAPDETLSWEESDLGRWGLNRRRDLPRLRFLSVQRSWTGRQLVNRLASEVPIRDPSRLTAVRMFQWQLGIPVYDELTPERFDIAAPHWRPSAGVRWLGAQAAADAALELRAEEVTGELWVALRSQPDGSSVRVGFTEDRWVIETTMDGRDRRLVTVPWPYSLKRKLRAAVIWRGERIVVRAGGEARQVRIPRAAAWRGPLEMVVYQKIRGVARAREVTARLVPLPPITPQGATGR